MLEGAKRLLSKPRKQTESLSIRTIDAIIKTYGQDSKDLPNLRFVAMSVLRFFGFLKFSEIANLRRSDIQFWDNHIELFIEKKVKLISTEMVLKSLNQNNVIKKLKNV